MSCCMLALTSSPSSISYASFWTVGCVSFGSVTGSSFLCVGSSFFFSFCWAR